MTSFQSLPFGAFKLLSPGIVTSPVFGFISTSLVISTAGLLAHILKMRGIGEQRGLICPLGSSSGSQLYCVSSTSEHFSGETASGFVVFAILSEFRGLVIYERVNWEGYGIRGVQSTASGVSEVADARHRRCQDRQ